MSNSKSSMTKFVVDDFEVEFEIIPDELILEKMKHDNRLDEIAEGQKFVDAQLGNISNKLSELNKEISRLTNHADGFDYMISVSSGIIAGLIDSLWVGEFSFERGKAWSNKTVNEFVMKIAKSQGYKGKRLEGAIKFLEGKFPIPSDSTWKDKDIGVSARSHHLDDLAHHPTILGLVFSILTQFTKQGYFQNSEGEFLPIDIDPESMELIGSSIPTKIFCGVTNWFFHLVSDMSGSSKSAGAGMGIPGPIVSLLKELSLIPGLNKTELSQKVAEIFKIEKFDLRSEIAVAHELGRQALPVLLNEIIVRVFYFIRRLIIELKAKKKLSLVIWKNTLPFKNRTIVRMLTIATATFTIIDLADAAIRAGIKKGRPFTPEFIAQFLLCVNFVGLGRFAVAVGTDIYMSKQRENLRDERIIIINQQLHLMNAKIFYSQTGMWIEAESAVKAIQEAYQIMENSTRLLITIWDENKKSLKNIGDMRFRIEENNPGLITDISRTLEY